MIQLIHVCEVIHLGELRLSIPDKLHKKLKKIAIDRGVTLKELTTDIFELFTEDTKNKVKKSSK
jgi:hypothetical protein